MITFTKSTRSVLSCLAAAMSGVLIAAAAGDVKGPPSRLSPTIDQFVADQAFRRELRKSIGWEQLSDEARRQWRDVAVGPDQLRADGTNLVSLTWGLDPSFQGVNNEIEDVFTDPLGNILICGTWENGSNVDRAWIAGVQGPDTSDWSSAKEWEDLIRWDDLPGTNPDGDPWDANDQLSYRIVKSDATGRVFVLGAVSSGESGDFHNSIFLARYSMVTSAGATTGARNWLRVYTELPDALGLFGLQLEVSPGGLVYFAYRQADGVFVAQVNPDADPLFGGDLQWSRHYDDTDDGTPPIVTNAHLRTDRSDRLLLARYSIFSSSSGDADVFTVQSLDPFDGADLWRTDVASVGDITDMAVDFDGAPILLCNDDDSASAVTIKFDAITGEESWRDVITNDGRPIQVDADINGNVFTLAENDSNDGFRLVRILANGTRDWARSRGNRKPGALAVDRFGNPLVLAGKGAFYEEVVTYKFDKNKDSGDGATPVWACDYALGGA